MLTRIVLSIVVAAVTMLVCILLGGVLVDLNVDVLNTIGAFLKDYASLIGVLAGVWYFFTGTNWPNRTV